MKPSSLFLKFDLVTKEVVRSELFYGTKKTGGKRVRKTTDRKPLAVDIDPRSKAFHQNICWSAMGKCDQCKSPDCSDRGWRERGAACPI